MDSDLPQKAIAAALNGKWEKAVAINKQILKKTPQDCEALNRLAKAFFELGKIKQARQICQKVLRLDQFNSISQRNLAKWKTVRSKGKTSAIPTSASDFIEEPGKTKLVTLLHPGDLKILAKLNAGDEVLLSPHAHRVSVTSLNQKYLGRLPDDLSARLRRLIKLGNSYRALIKSIDGRNIKVFIKETLRAKSLQETPSFPVEKISTGLSVLLEISRKLTA